MFALTEEKKVHSFMFHPCCFVCTKPPIKEKPLISLKKLSRFVEPDLQ